jgi:enoyl-CoA hydratase/carnithine racemase
MHWCNRGKQRNLEGVASQPVAKDPMFARGFVAPFARYARFASTYKNILSEKLDNGVGLVRLNRPPVNALNHELLTELLVALKEHERDATVGCIVLTGSSKAFAAGADIKEMAGRGFSEFRLSDPADSLMVLGDVAKCRKPIVAAVDGFVFGGGAELAMSCDIIIASEKAVFGQPEIKLGIIPGGGGTQRLTRAVGKSKAMQMNLTGEPINAAAAERAGLVSEVGTERSGHVLGR